MLPLIGRPQTSFANPDAEFELVEAGLVCQLKAENDAFVKHFLRQNLHIQVLSLRWWRRAWRIRWRSSMQQPPACGTSCGGSSCMLLSRQEWLSGTLACPRSGVACCGAPSGLPTNASSDTCAWLPRSASISAAAAAAVASSCTMNLV